MKNLFLIAIIVLGFSGVSFGVGPLVTGTSAASATIMATLTIANSIPLNFGVISAGTLASTVSIGGLDVRNVATGDAALLSFGAPAKTGVFAITGTPNAAFSITVPAGPVALTGTTMTITGFTSDLGTTSTLSATGTQTLKVGGILNVGINQAAGTFSGNYDVTVNYN